MILNFGKEKETRESVNIHESNYKKMGFLNVNGWHIVFSQKRFCNNLLECIFLSIPRKFLSSLDICFPYILCSILLDFRSKHLNSAFHLCLIQEGNAFHLLEEILSFKDMVGHAKCSALEQIKATYSRTDIFPKEN